MSIALTATHEAEGEHRHPSPLTLRSTIMQGNASIVIALGLAFSGAMAGAKSTPQANRQLLRYKSYLIKSNHDTQRQIVTKRKMLAIGQNVWVRTPAARACRAIQARDRRWAPIALSEDLAPSFDGCNKNTGLLVWLSRSPNVCWQSSRRGSMRRSK
jgi:hypothetical protein